MQASDDIASANAAAIRLWVFYASSSCNTVCMHAPVRHDRLRVASSDEVFAGWRPEAIQQVGCQAHDAGQCAMCDPVPAADCQVVDGKLLQECKLGLCEGSRQSFD
jgi:hypothetical protein